jgi:DNA repair protein RadC
MPDDSAKPDAPRDKLLFYGAEKLSDAELLAVLIGGDTPGRTDVLAAQGALCEEEDGFAYIAGAVPSELTRNLGMNKAAACRISAAVEFGKRIAARPKSERTRIAASKDAANIFMPKMRYLKNECFWIMLLNTRNEIIAMRRVSEGTVNSSFANPREVFGFAVKCGASSLIAAHNHPSGDPSPSAEDKKSTLRLTDAGRILGIELADHIIIGDGEYFSMRENKMMNAA